MGKRVQDEAPARSAEAKAWVEENVADQERRYASIVKEIEDLEPTRAKWYEEFLTIAQTKGYNVTGDQRRKITPEEVPTKPDRPDKVVW